jgi:hypothetical protein
MLNLPQEQSQDDADEKRLAIRLGGPLANESGGFLPHRQNFRTFLPLSRLLNFFFFFDTQTAPPALLATSYVVVFLYINSFHAN